MTEKKFNPVAYNSLIEEFRRVGYQVRDYADAETNRADLILRHDVDMSLVFARDMAALEQSIGARSTYFILVRTEFYNVFSEAGTKLVREIANYGHDIGLHFDAALYGDNDIDTYVSKECEMLEFALGQKVRTVSFHRPAKTLIGSAPTLGGRTNAYAPRFVKEMGYCSDSRGGWHYGHPLMQAAVREKRALHLLTHPVWWMGEEAAMTDRLHKFLQMRKQELDIELSRHCVIHKPRSEPAAR